MEKWWVCLPAVLKCLYAWQRLPWRLCSMHTSIGCPCLVATICRHNSEHLEQLCTFTDYDFNARATGAHDHKNNKHNYNNEGTRRIWLVLLFWWSRYEYSHRQLLLLLHDLCSVQLTCAFWVLGGEFLIGCQGLEPIPGLKARASKNVVILEATVFVWRQTTQLVTFREQGTRFWKWSNDKIIEHRTDTCAHLW
jgi:hypothetical protein